MSATRIALAVGLALCWLQSCFADEPSGLVRVEKGNLPIILSAPHGGDKPVPGAEPRQGEGQARVPGGFVVTRDGGTLEFADLVFSELSMRLGKKPHLVVCLAHRKYVDSNRESKWAYEGDAAKMVYETYHKALEDACRNVREKSQRGLLLDIHGQGAMRDMVYRGTQNGETVKLLRERFGEAAHSGDLSLFGLLKSRGWNVFPKPLTAKEQPGFTGGYTVKHYGGDGGFGIDAIQLELGGDYRTEKVRPQAAKVLAQAIVDFANLYLEIPQPNEKHDEANGKNDFKNPADSKPQKKSQEGPVNKKSPAIPLRSKTNSEWPMPK